MDRETFDNTKWQNDVEGKTTISLATPAWIRYDIGFYVRRGQISSRMNTVII